VREKKRMVALMIEDVTLTRGTEITMHVRFKGGLPTSGELWRRRGDGLSISIVARNRLCILPPALRLTLLVSGLAFATHAMRESR